MRALVAASVPFVRFRVERVLAAADLSSAEGRDRALAALGAVLAALRAERAARGARAHGRWAARACPSRSVASLAAATGEGGGATRSRAPVDPP